MALGGLNIDPFSSEQEIGRLRRFYVSRDYRRKGIGKLLLAVRSIEEVKVSYEFQKNANYMLTIKLK
nr:GNAT family N-acetyltransferase [Bacillus gaemokensis]